MAFRWLQTMFRRESKRFNIYREYCKSVDPEQRLKENPYYEKYATKIADLEKVSTEEFNYLLNEKLKLYAMKPAPVKRENGKISENNDIPRFSGQKELGQIMKLEKLADKSPEEIESIWKQYHQSKDGLYAVLPKKIYDKMCVTLKTYPLFLFPLPRAQGYEFILHQYMENSCYFTSLINFQVYKENAPVSLTITYFTELSKDKGLVLMRGEYDDKALNIQEAQCLANQLQLYYGDNDDKYGAREKILWMFNYEPEFFKHTDLISNFENDLIK